MTVSNGTRSKPRRTSSVLKRTKAVRSGVGVQTASAAHNHAKPKPAAAAAPIPGKPTGLMETQAKHAFIIEADTGTVLLDAHRLASELKAGPELFQASWGLYINAARNRRFGALDRTNTLAR